MLVQDNLNTHTPASLYEAFEPAEARRIIERFEWHYTPNAVFAAEPRENETLITPRVELIACDFSGAKLQKADLGYNNLGFARFINADVRGASFVEA